MTQTADDIARTLRYKVHSGAIAPGAPPASSSDPGATGGQLLRIVNHTLNPQRNNFTANEKTTHRQVISNPLGAHGVAGTVNGLLSAGTWNDFIDAVHRGTRSAAISKTNSDFTSMTIATGVATVGGSTWAAQGFMVGDVIRFTNMSVAANNSKNFQIIALSGTAATLWPTPTDNSVDSSFTVATIGKKSQPPASSQTALSYFFEDYGSDVDLSEVYYQCRATGYHLAVPPEGNVTIGVDFMGRYFDALNAGGSPFFASPTAETSSAVMTSLNGQLLIGGTAVAVVTGMTIDSVVGGSANPAAFTAYKPEIYTGEFDCTGQLVFDWFSSTYAQALRDETEYELAFMITDTSADAADFVSGFIPRLKITSYNKAGNANANVPVTAQFRALKKATTTGYDATTIVIQDSQAS